LHSINRDECGTFDNVEEHWIDLSVTDGGEMGCEFVPFGPLSGENHVMGFFDFVTHCGFYFLWFLVFVGCVLRPIN
jgi:hypothetical protein